MSGAPRRTTLRFVGRWWLPVLGLWGCGDSSGAQLASLTASTAPPTDVASVSAEPSAAPPPAPSREERWLGKVEVPNAPALVFELKFDLERPSVATLVIPAQQLGPTDLRDVAMSPTSMRFKLPLPVAPGASADFVLERGPLASTATGTLVQQGVTMKVTARRLSRDERLSDAMYPQTPRPPFPYTERDARYTSRDGTKLAGTLTLPKAGARAAAVLLISGTGEQDRDQTLSGHKPFLVLADHLTRAGIAVLRVDDRGVGGSTGSTSQTGFEGKVEDILAGMAWLAEQPEIDPARIGLVGHSEGGILAPLAAIRAQAPPVAFLVLLAAPGVSGVKLLTKQMDQTLRAQNVSAERLALGNSGQKRVLEAVLAGADDRALRKLVEEHVDAIIGLTPSARPGWLQRSAMVDAAMLQVASPAMRDVIRSEPARALEEVRCPVLALGGTVDLQVPGEENIAAIRAALDRGRNPDVTTEVLVGLNHLFQPATLGTMQEWTSIETTMAPAVLERIASWLRQRG